MENGAEICLLQECKLVAAKDTITFAFMKLDQPKPETIKTEPEIPKVIEVQKQLKVD